jgi:hypothetical protein
MATEISVFDSDEFEELVSNRDVRISKFGFLKKFSYIK